MTISRLSPTHRSFTVAVLALVAACSSIADPADEFLVRAFVPDGHVVSLLPPQDGSPVSRVWGDNQRRTAWRRRVASRFSYSAAVGLAPLTDRDIELVACFDPFVVRLDSVGLGIATSILSDGAEGMEIVSLSDSGSVENVRTNRYRLEFREESPRLRYVPSPGENLRTLRLDRSAGQTVWLVSWNDLRTRWEKRMQGDPRSVRNEMAALSDSGRFLDAAGGEAWKTRVEEWLRDPKRASLWPRIVFENVETNTIVVSCGGSSQRIDPGKTWTHVVRALPSDGLLRWSFKIARSDWHEEDYDFEDFTIAYAADARDDLDVKVHAGLLRARPYPRLVLDFLLAPSKALRRAAEDGELRFRVKYRGEETARPLAYCPPTTDGGWGFYELEPHRRVERIEIEAGRAWKEGVLLPESDADGLARGAFLQVKGGVELLPWPSVVISNSCDRTVTNTLSVVNKAGNVVPAVYERPIILDPGAEEPRRSLGDTLVSRVGEDDAEFDYVLRIQSTAAFADPATTNVPFARGGDSLVLSPLPVLHDLPPPPEPEILPWPTKDQTRKNSFYRLAKKLYPKINRDYPFDNLQNPVLQKNVEEEAFASPDGGIATSDSPPVAILRHHLKKCPLPGCKDCEEFRKRNAKWLPEDGSAPDNIHAFAALYHDWLLDYPDKVRASAEEDTEYLLKRLTSK